jgi:hypothetical protein
MKKSGSAAGTEPDGPLVQQRHTRRYSELLSLLPRAMRLEGIEPPWLRENLLVMLCPLGRRSAITARENSFHVLAVGLSTARLSARGQGVRDNHQTYSTESLTRIRRTFTHSAGAGSLAGLNQKLLCQMKSKFFGQCKQEFEMI